MVLRTPDGDRLEFLTNHLTLGASTVARIYQDRWQIELFFKALKQNLRVKTFVGTSANALHIQIWTALIALLLLKYLQLKAALRLVAVESRRLAPHESVRLSRPLDVARRTVYRAAGAARACPTGSGLRVTWTA